MPYKTKAGKAEYDAKRYVRRTREFRKDFVAHDSTIGDPLPSAAIEWDIPAPKHGLKIAVIPDCQVKEGVPTGHLSAAGMYIAEKRPDVVVCIGDFWDFESLSKHDAAGSLQKEGKRYKKDVDAGLRGMDRLMGPIQAAAGYSPHLVFTLGNHENRQRRIVEDYPFLEGTIGPDDLRLQQYGWRTVPFLQPITIGGVAFCHFFPTGVMGKPVTTAADLLRKMHMSCFAGHQQGRQTAYGRRGDGRELISIISGSFYEHDEPYLSPLTNIHWRGMWFLHETKDGTFDDMALSLGYLKRRYK